jgi:hypothetical protein
MAKKETTKTDVPALEVYIAQHETDAMAIGQVVTKIIHPDGAERVFPGRYAGIPVEAGELSAIYSDGSKH